MFKRVRLLKILNRSRRAKRASPIDERVPTDVSPEYVSYFIGKFVGGGECFESVLPEDFEVYYPEEE